MLLKWTHTRPRSVVRQNCSGLIPLIAPSSISRLCLHLLAQRDENKRSLGRARLHSFTAVLTHRWICEVECDGQMLFSASLCQPKFHTSVSVSAHMGLSSLKAVIHVQQLEVGKSTICIYWLSLLLIFSLLMHQCISTSWLNNIKLFQFQGLCTVQLCSQSLWHNVNTRYSLYVIPSV